MTVATDRSIAAWVFDAYGTLFDVHSIAVLAEELMHGHGVELARLWRTRQLDYTWLQSLMLSPTQRREDFAAITAHALDHAVATLAQPLSEHGRQRLLDAYRSLAPFADVQETLAALAPRPRWILSNGTQAMLEPLVRSAGLRHHLAGILSVDEVNVYKPAPAVYQLACDRLRVAPEHIGFVSSNCWDAIGARAFGFRSFWINRTGAPVDRHGPAPDFIVRSLADLPALLQ
jgi:2-haloacid dehalogenase